MACGNRNAPGWRPAHCCCRVQKDGETIAVNFEKDAASGMINNQLDNVTFKVQPAGSAACTGAACVAARPLRRQRTPTTCSPPPLQFDGVLVNSSQDALYNSCAQEAVDTVLSGLNSTVFCYGQVGLSARAPQRRRPAVPAPPFPRTAMPGQAMQHRWPAVPARTVPTAMPGSLGGGSTHRPA
jgi:hypothetical protein